MASVPRPWCLLRCGCSIQTRTDVLDEPVLFEICASLSDPDSIGDIVTGRMGSAGKSGSSSRRCSKGNDDPRAAPRSRRARAQHPPRGRARTLRVGTTGTARLAKPRDRRETARRGPTRGSTPPRHARRGIGQRARAHLLDPARFARQAIQRRTARMARVGAKARRGRRSRARRGPAASTCGRRQRRRRSRDGHGGAPPARRTREANVTRAQFPDPGGGRAHTTQATSERARIFRASACWHRAVIPWERNDLP